MYEDNPVDKFRNLHRQKFMERLQQKTGWGRNELMQQYDQAATDALMEMMKERLVK